MLRSCRYCGRVHDGKQKCPQREDAERKRWMNRKHTDALQFRRTNMWTNKSIDIRTRDRYICLCCKAQLPGTVIQLNTKNLSVHHIVPIEEDYNMRLSDSNLITVCDVHHEMCEAEQISRDTQRYLVEQSMRENGDTNDDVCVVL